MRVGTQVSFAPPPWPLFTTIEPRSSATRLIAAGSTRAPVGGQERVGAQVHVARLEPAVDDGRVHRQLHALLADPAAGLRGDLRSHALARLLVGIPPDHDPLAAHLAARLDHQLVELVVRPEQARRDRGQQRLLVEVEADQLVHVGVHELVVGDAGAGRVHHGERARGGRPQQRLARPRSACRPQP